MLQRRGGRSVRMKSWPSGCRPSLMPRTRCLYLLTLLTSPRHQHQHMLRPSCPATSALSRQLERSRRMDTRHRLRPGGSPLSLKRHHGHQNHTTTALVPRRAEMCAPVAEGHWGTGARPTSLPWAKSTTPSASGAAITLECILCRAHKVQ